MDLTLHTLVAGGEWQGGEGVQLESSCSSLLVRSMGENSTAAECSTWRSAEHGLTSIEMLNVARRWNKESRFYFPICAPRCRRVNWNGNEAFPSTPRGNAWYNTKRYIPADYAYSFPDGFFYKEKEIILSILSSFLSSFLRFPTHLLIKFSWYFSLSIFFHRFFVILLSLLVTKIRNIAYRYFDVACSIFLLRKIVLINQRYLTLFTMISHENTQSEEELYRGKPVGAAYFIGVAEFVLQNAYA